MSDSNYMEILQVLDLFARYDACDSVWWRTDGEFAPVTFLVSCNDLFVWGCSDAQEITPDNFKTLVAAFADAAAAHEIGEIYGPELFCARVRKMRPQGAAYPQERDLWPLFDACGPERAIDFANPRRPGE